MTYVKLEDVLNIIKEQNCNNTGIIQHIKQHCRTADVVEVKHGEWQEHYSNGCWHYDCPFCDDGFAMKEKCKTKPNYCEDCGAKMDGGKANDL